MSSSARVITGIGLAAGLLLVAHGTRLLITGRVPRAFRTVRAAGRYHLLFGAAMILVAGGTALPAGPIAFAVNLTAVALAGVAVIRFRPRGRSRAGDRSPEAVIEPGGPVPGE